MTLFLCLPAAAKSEPKPVALLEPGLPAVAERWVMKLADAAAAGGAPALTVERSSERSDRAAGAGDVAVAVLPIDHFVDRVKAADLFSVPFLLGDPRNWPLVLSRSGKLRISFDTVTVNFSVRILALMPLGFKGFAWFGDGASEPDDLSNLRILANGPAELGFAAALNAVAVSAEPTDAAIAAPWESRALARRYLDLRHAPSLLAVVMHEPTWLALNSRQQQAWHNAVDQMEALGWRAVTSTHNAALDSLRDAGVKVVSASAESQAVWRAAVAISARTFYRTEGRQLARAYLRAFDKAVQTLP